MIPRPPTAVPGGPAPWARSATGSLVGITLVRITEALARAGLLLTESPGPPAPAPRWRSIRAADSGQAPDGISAAVLVALFEEGGETRVVLTRRSPALRSHTGQISFPGGRIDPGEDPVTTARREAWEEVGLAPGLVTPLAWLPVAVTFSNGTAIAPVVATLRGRPELVASPSEVARVFDVSLAELAAAFREERWTEPEAGTFAVYFYDVATENVWGATARMLTELLTLVLVGTDGP